MENRKRFGVRNTYHTPKAKNQTDFTFGVQSVLELLKSEKDIEKILVQKDFSHPEVEALARSKNTYVQRVTVERLNRYTRKNHQGIIAFASAINYAKLSNIVANVYEDGKTPTILILDRLTDVRNFGAIARTAEACSVNAIVVPTRGAAQLNGEPLKTSSGALSHIPVCRENDLTDAIEHLQLSGFHVVACTEKAEEDYYGQDFLGPVAIVMGSEEDGISDSIIRKCDSLAKIPMTGKVGSLNVSVATAVMLYEVVRQRRV